MASLARVCLRGALAHGSRSQIARNLSVSAVTKKDYGKFMDVLYDDASVIYLSFQHIWPLLTKIGLFFDRGFTLIVIVLLNETSEMSV